jgi:hypothetical protein
MHIRFDLSCRELRLPAALLSSTLFTLSINDG